MIEILVKDERVHAGVESADVEEAGGGDDWLVWYQDGGKDAPEVQASVVGVTNPLGMTW